MKSFLKMARGYTLIEVLVALIVLSSGLLGVALLNTTSTRFSHNSLLRSQASLLAAEIVERMRLNAAQARADAYDFTLAAALPATTENCEATIPTPLPNCTTSQLASFDRGRWAARVSALLPSGDAAIATDATVNPVRVVVTLQWDDSRGQVAPVTQEFEMNLSNL